MRESLLLIQLSIKSIQSAITIHYRRSLAALVARHRGQGSKRRERSATSCSLTLGAVIYLRSSVAPYLTLEALPCTPPTGSYSFAPVVANQAAGAYSFESIAGRGGAPSCLTHIDDTAGTADGFGVIVFCNLSVGGRINAKRCLRRPEPD